jgi:hypothetical protein
MPPSKKRNRTGKAPIFRGLWRSAFVVTFIVRPLVNLMRARPCSAIIIANPGHGQDVYH